MPRLPSRTEQSPRAPALVEGDRGRAENSRTAMRNRAGPCGRAEPDKPCSRRPPFANYEDSEESCRDSQAENDGKIHLELVSSLLISLGQALIVFQYFFIVYR